MSAPASWAIFPNFSAFAGITETAAFTPAAFICFTLSVINSVL
jgi:hypothetical protein